MIPAKYLMRFIIIFYVIMDSWTLKKCIFPLHYITFLNSWTLRYRTSKWTIHFYLLISWTYVSSRITLPKTVNYTHEWLMQKTHIQRYIHSTWLVLSNSITPSQSAFVYLSTWFFRHKPWIILTPRRVHLAVWHHLSTFIDIHILHLVENINYKHTFTL